MEDKVKAELKTAYDEFSVDAKAKIEELDSKVKTLEEKKISAPAVISSNMYKGHKISNQFKNYRGKMSDESLDYLAKSLIEMKNAALSNKSIDMKAAAAHVEGTDESGGHLVINEYADMIETFARENSVLAPLCRQVSVANTDTLLVNKALTECSISIDAEGSVTQTSSTLAQVTIPIKRLGGYVAVSNELLADASYDVASWITEQFTYGIGQKLDSQILSGTGTGAGQMNSGVLTAAVTNSVILSGTNLSSITATDLSLALAQLSTLDAQKATFVLGKLGDHYVRSLKDSNSAPVFQAISGPNLDKIYGNPRVVCASISDNPSATASTAYGVVGNFNQVFLVNRLGGLSLMVDPYSDSVSYNTRFIFSMRKGFGVVRGDALTRIITGA